MNLIVNILCSFLVPLFVLPFFYLLPVKLPGNVFIIIVSRTAVISKSEHTRTRIRKLQKGLDWLEPSESTPVFQCPSLWLCELLAPSILCSPCLHLESFIFSLDLVEFIFLARFLQVACPSSRH